MIGTLIFLLGIALWVCKSNSFLVVNGWVIFLCLSFGYFLSLVQTYANSLAKNINQEMAKKIAELNKQKDISK